MLIFPQGTRLLPQERTKFKKGTGRIYDTLKKKCQPIALNSGYVWPKNKPLLNNRTITLSILKPIDPGLNKEDFLNLLEQNIHGEVSITLELIVLLLYNCFLILITNIAQEIVKIKLGILKEKFN